MMHNTDLRQRTKKYALNGIKFVESLPRTRTADIIGKQLLRCVTSVGTNYRSACCGKSAADFVGKLAIVHEEADESLYWMELLLESSIVTSEEIQKLRCNGTEIVAMAVASLKTARRNIASKRKV